PTEYLRLPIIRHQRSNSRPSRSRTATRAAAKFPIMIGPFLPRRPERRPLGVQKLEVVDAAVAAVRVGAVRRRVVGTYARFLPAPAARGDPRRRLQRGPVMQD